MAEFGDIQSNLALGAGKSVRRNAGDTDFEAFTPGAGAGALDDLTDVVITTPADNDVLTYDSGSGDWINAAPSSTDPTAIHSGDAAGGDLGGTYPNPTVSDDSHDHTFSTVPHDTLDGLTDVTITTPSDDEVLTYSSGSWINAPAVGGIGGSTGATDNAVLRADGTGGATVQSSLVTIDDSGKINIPTGQTYDVNGSPHTHAAGVSRSGSTTDEHLAVWNGTDADSIKDGGAVPSGGAPTTTPYITTAADAGLSAEVVIPGFAGSADIAGAAGAGTAEEYDTATTGLTWNNTPTTVNSNTTVKSHLYILNQADATERLGTKSWSPAGALDARCKLACAINFSQAGGGILGMHIGNSDNTSRVLIQILMGSNAPSIAAYTYATGSYTQRGSSWVSGAGMMYLRITRDGSNNWKFYVSGNGVIWSLIATQALTFTVANIGFRISSTASGTAEGIVDWLRTDV